MKRTAKSGKSLVDFVLSGNGQQRQAGLLAKVVAAGYLVKHGRLHMRKLNKSHFCAEQAR
jgi:hypothetical protein